MRYRRLRSSVAAEVFANGVEVLDEAGRFAGYDVIPGHAYPAEGRVFADRENPMRL